MMIWMNKDIQYYYAHFFNYRYTRIYDANLLSTVTATGFHGTLLNLRAETFVQFLTHTRVASEHVTQRRRLHANEFSSCDSCWNFCVFERAVFGRLNPSFEFIAFPFHRRYASRDIFFHDSFLAGEF